MKLRKFWLVISLLLVASLVLVACKTTTPEPTKEPVVEPTVVTTEAPTAAPEEFIFGVLMVGPYNDHGWSEAHYQAGLYVESKIPGTKMIYTDKVNTADRPGTTPAQLAEELVAQGAKLIIFNSDDMKDSAVEFATDHPEIFVIHPSGDNSWKDGMAYKEMPNFVNVMGEMEYGKMIAGCTAALTTKTGQIGYLGPLINDETRRLASSVYLGAKHCWTEVLGKDAKDLKVKVTWIGFWFNIPGMTSDPTQVADDFINNNYDVIISGIDTTEALAEAKKFNEQGKEVWAIPYDYIGACKEAEGVCLGVPYFNWGPSYVKYVQAAIDGTFASAFEWMAPDWTDINNPDTSAVGFVKGAALSAEAAEKWMPLLLTSQAD